MREIKFRTWSTEFKKMFSVEEIRWDIGGERLRSIGAYRLDDNGHAEGTWDDRIVRGEGNFKFLILMQFTGFKDKGGKDIYEGDIVEFEDFRGVYTQKQSRHDGEVVARGIVEWRDRETGFAIDKENEFNEKIKKAVGREAYDRDMVFVWGLHSAAELSIVGNIHETPELVKV